MNKIRQTKSSQNKMSCLVEYKPKAAWKPEATVRAGCLGRDNWGQLWEEHWILSDKRKQKRKKGSLWRKEQSQAERSTTDRKWRLCNPQRKGSRRAWTPKLNLVWDPGYALGTSLHVSGLGVFICEMVVVILISQSNYGKNCTWRCPNHAWHVGSDQYIFSQLFTLQGLKTVKN